jgi:hypothetical protein
MKRLTSISALLAVTSATLGLSVTGCLPKDDADEYRGGVPLRETVALHVPGAPDSGGALTAEGGGGARTSALLGQKADTYTLTRVVTAVVNGGTWAVLSLVRTVVGYPATTVDKLAQTAVWGPYTDALSPNTWKLTVKRLEAQKYQWTFEGRAKTEDDSAFRKIITGTHTAVVDAQGEHLEGFGSGSFTIDWDKAAELPEHDKNVGVAAFTYSRKTTDAVVTIDVDFTGIQDDKTLEIFNAKYRYSSTPGAGGSLRYAEDKDNSPEPGNTGTAKEHFTIQSRWTEDGTGRCDLQDAGGDLGAVVGQANECWDSNFKSVYRNLNYTATPLLDNWGAETSCTAFPTPAYVTDL